MPLSLRQFALQTTSVVGALAISGLLIRRIGGDDPAEDRLVRKLQAAFGHGPTPAIVIEGTADGPADTEVEAIDIVTGALSWYSGVPQTIANGAAWCGITWLLTREWRSAVAPGAALVLETACFVGSAALVGRPRPERVWRPEAPHATSSFPSGHTAAAFALHGTLANLLVRHGRGNWLARYLLRFEIPGAIALSRVYRGQHHISDVVAGALLGLWSAHTTRRALLS